MIMLIFIKQHLSNIWSFMRKLSNTEAELKKALLIKKGVYLREVYITPVFLYCCFE